MKIAIELCKRKIPQIMLHELVLNRNNSAHFRRAVMQTLKGISKHSPELAGQIVEFGGLEAFMVCLEDTDAMVKLILSCNYKML